MSAKPARHLSLVDTETGEIVESRELASLQAELEELKTKFRMAQRDVAAKNLRIANLEADHARRRLEHDRYQDAVRVAKYWWKRCRGGHHRVHYLSPDRIDAVLAIMDMEEMVRVEGRKRRQRRPKFSMVDFKMAVDGAHFDHYVSKRRNGSEQHYDDLELICRGVAKFEEFIARCPYPREVAERALMRDNEARVPTPPPDPGGTWQEGDDDVQGGPLAGARGRVPGSLQAAGPPVRVRVADGDAGAPAVV